MRELDKYGSLKVSSREGGQILLYKGPQTTLLQGLQLQDGVAIACSNIISWNTLTVNSAYHLRFSGSNSKNKPSFAIVKA